MSPLDLLHGNRARWSTTNTTNMPCLLQRINHSEPEPCCPCLVLTACFMPFPALMQGGQHNQEY